MAALHALLFDMDGTLVDTDDVHFKAYQTVLEREGLEITRRYYDREMSGRPNPEILRGLLPSRSEDERNALIEEKETRFRDGANDLRATPGLHDLLAWSEDKGVRRIVVTSAPGVNADFMLGGLELQDAFEDVVLAERLERGKPDPLPYQVGLERLGVAAEHALAFEDSLAGVRSASGAGIETVALATTQTPNDLRAAGASLVITDFRDDALWQRLRERLGLSDPSSA